MSDAIFFHGADGWSKAEAQPFKLEAHLQDMLADRPDLIPGAQIDSETPRRWLLLKKEAGVPSQEGGGDNWSVDHLFVDQEGVPTFVEVKRASDTRGRREVVAQMLDYAANGTAYWDVATLRSWFEAGDPAGARDRLEEFLDRDDEGDIDERIERFWSSVGENLKTARVRLVFVADAIPTSLRRLVEFLNEHLQRVEVLAVEIKQFVAQDGVTRALVPRLIGQTAQAKATKGIKTARRSQPWTVAEVIAAFSQQRPESSWVVTRVLEWAATHTKNMSVRGGTGIANPSLILAAFTTQAHAKGRTLLCIYGGADAFLEVRLNRMRRSKGWSRGSGLDSFYNDVHALGIPRLTGPIGVLRTRPNVPVGQLTPENLNRLLGLLDRWIGDFKLHGDEGDADDDGSDD